MALIKCTECGHMISDKTTKCPKCGCPTKEALVPHQEDVASDDMLVYDEEEDPTKKWLYGIIALLLAAIAGGGYLAYSKWLNDDRRKEAIVELTPEFIKAIEKYDRLGPFSEGMAAVCKNGKWGVINTKGEEVMPPTIDAECIGRFSEGMAFVLKSDKGSFSVINTNGEIIFQGNQIHEFNHPESEELPYFIKGKIYIPTAEADKPKYEVYDQKGNKIEIIDWEEAKAINAIAQNGNYTVYSYEGLSAGDGENSVSRIKWGIKDSIDNVVINAKYDYMSCCGENGGKVSIPNGVVLVVLEELDEEYFTSGEKEKHPKRYYGYADLKGNDTFTRDIKEHCSKVEQMVFKKYQKKLDDEKMPTFNDICTLIDKIMAESRKVGPPYYRLPKLQKTDPVTKMELLDVDSSEFEEEENSMLHAIYGKNAIWKYNYSLEFQALTIHACFMVYRESGCHWVDIGFKNKADADAFAKQINNRGYERHFDTGLENRWSTTWNNHGWWIISWDDV